MQCDGCKLAHTARTQIRLVWHVRVSFRLARQITVLSREFSPQWSVAVSVIVVRTIWQHKLEQLSLSVRIWDTRAGEVTDSDSNECGENNWTLLAVSLTKPPEDERASGDLQITLRQDGSGTAEFTELTLVEQGAA